MVTSQFGTRSVKPDIVYIIKYSCFADFMLVIYRHKLRWTKGDSTYLMPTLVIQPKATGA
jgi:hypothetical protein